MYYQRVTGGQTDTGVMASLVSRNHKNLAIANRSCINCTDNT